MVAMQRKPRQQVFCGGGRKNPQARRVAGTALRPRPWAKIRGHVFDHVRLPSRHKKAPRRTEGKAGGRQETRHNLRIRPRNGQQRRVPVRLLGARPQRAHVPGRIHMGLERPGHIQKRRTGCENLRLGRPEKGYSRVQRHRLQERHGKRLRGGFSGALQVSRKGFYRRRGNRRKRVSAARRVRRGRSEELRTRAVDAKRGNHSPPARRL